MAQRAFWMFLLLLFAQGCVLGDLGGTRSVYPYDQASETDAGAFERDGRHADGGQVDEGAAVDELVSMGDAPDAEPGLPAHDAGAADEPTGVSEPVVCFYTLDDREHPAATIAHQRELLAGVDTWHAMLTLDTRIVDNSFGENAIGWSATGARARRTHGLNDLVESDHAVLSFVDAAGDAVLKVKVDYLSKDAEAPSGFSSLGVSAGDGKVLLGDPAAVVHVSTSLDRNFNERGYADFIGSSPETDDRYTPALAAPDWEYAVVYDVWVNAGALGKGRGSVLVDSVHASPSKLGSDTITLRPDGCPRERVTPP